MIHTSQVDFGQLGDFIANIHKMSIKCCYTIIVCKFINDYGKTEAKYA